ncbi:MAG: type II secretion system protein [Planctomycetota bacterium]|nr:MAG: type II secretion system protein [Planctomycetota bacterium]
MIELIVVLGIIGLVLGIGLPAFNQMSRQSRKNQAEQLLNGAMLRAHVTAVSSRSLVAARIVPGEWTVRTEDDLTTARALAGRQVVELYQYSFSWADPTDIEKVEFDERFERLRDVPPIVLPPDIWAAPAEAAKDPKSGLNNPYDWTAIVDGQIGRFEVDAARDGEDFYDADDFLIVFDPQTGVQASSWPAGSAGNPELRRSAWRMNAYDPVEEAVIPYELQSGNTLNFSRPFQRFNFTGVAIYERQPFLDYTQGLRPLDRQRWLRDFATVFYVNRRGGDLVAGKADS